MFVGLGDAKVGYNIDRGHIDPIQSSDQQPGFYAQGKGAYYLKGQILGKYLITSSFDTDRQQKALFRSWTPMCIIRSTGTSLPLITMPRTPRGRCT